MHFFVGGVLYFCDCMQLSLFTAMRTVVDASTYIAFLLQLLLLLLPMVQSFVFMLLLYLVFLLLGNVTLLPLLLLLLVLQLLLLLLPSVADAFAGFNSGVVASTTFLLL